MGSTGWDATRDRELSGFPRDLHPQGVSPARHFLRSGGRSRALAKLTKISLQQVLFGFRPGGRLPQPSDVFATVRQAASHVASLSVLLAQLIASIYSIASNTHTRCVHHASNVIMTCRRSHPATAEITNGLRYKKIQIGDTRFPIFLYHKVFDTKKYKKLYRRFVIFGYFFVSQGAC